MATQPSDKYQQKYLKYKQKYQTAQTSNNMVGGKMCLTDMDCGRDESCNHLTHSGFSIGGVHVSGNCEPKQHNGYTTHSSCVIS